MEKKTHIMGANLVALSVVRPYSISGLLVTVLSASLGGMLPDVDLKDSIPDKIFDRLMVSLITIICLFLILKYGFNIDLYDVILDYNSFFGYFISAGVFIFMAYLGSKTSHRSFTHSFLGLLIYTSILSYGFNSNIFIPFSLGYSSHLVLDFFNLKGVSLFYPSKTKFGVKLCESSGKVNKFLFILFSLLCVLVLIFLSFN